MVLFFLLIVAVITVVPVMIAARVVRAGRTGFFHALFSLLLQIGASFWLAVFVHISSAFLQSLVGWLVGAAVFAVVMDTTFVKGMIISVLSVIIAIIIVLLFGGMAGLNLHHGLGPTNSSVVMIANWVTHQG